VTTELDSKNKFHKDDLLLFESLNEKIDDSISMNQFYSSVKPWEGEKLGIIEESEVYQKPEYVDS
jgi:hypothetical protein